MEKQRIEIEAVINNSITRVWELFTTPIHIMQWNNASDDWHTPKAVNDLRVGGTFINTMAAKDGSFSFDFTGTYDEIDKESRISYTIGDGRKVTVLFQPVDQGVKVIEQFEPEQMNPEEMQKAGWQAILNNFKRYVESN